VPVRRHGRRWQIRVSAGGGRRLERTLPPGATRRDALDAEAALRRAQIDVAAGRAPQRLIDEALDRYEDSARQLRSYAHDLRYRIAVIRGYTQGRTLADLAAIGSQLQKDGRESGLAPGTINRSLAIIRRVGRLAERWGWIEHAPPIDLLPGEKARHVYLTPAQVQALCKVTDDEFGDFIRLAVLSGMRRGEILGLRPSDVRDGGVVLHATKSGRPRVVPLPPEALRIAQERLPWGFGPVGVFRRFKAARDAVGLSHVRLHDLRHTYASWLVQAGQSLTAVRDLLGHSNLAVTSRYSHLAPEHLREAVNALPNLRHRGTRAGQKSGK
jgi:integrase